MRLLLPAAALAALLTACDSLPTEDRLALDAVGHVAGVVYLDRDGDGLYGRTADLPAEGIRVTLVRGARDTVAAATSDAEGRVVLPDVPVGSYRLAPDAAQMGDSLVLALPDSAALVVNHADTTAVALGLGVRLRTVAEVRARTGGLVAMEAVALNQWSAFGDSTVHLRDATGAMRAVRVPGGGIEEGDSLRLTGQVEVLGGRAVLAQPRATVLARRVALVAAPVGTGAAASADGGRLEAGLVRVEEARVVDRVVLPSGDLRLWVDDGSGRLDVVLDRNGAFTPEDPVVPGAVLDVQGVLVPAEEAGRWVLKPRSASDFAARLPTLTIREARGMAGRVVSVVGIALNGWIAYSDGAIHLADGTGAIRLYGVSQPIVEAGDSLRVVGVVVPREGQPVISASTVSLRDRGRPLPPPAPVTTAAAAGADGGRLDAGLVRVSDAAVTAATATDASVRLTLDDGSGPLSVVLDRNGGYDASLFPVGTRVDVVGLLMPMATGGWLLRPRTPADITRR